MANGRTERRRFRALIEEGGRRGKGTKSCLFSRVRRDRERFAPVATGKLQGVQCGLLAWKDIAATSLSLGKRKWWQIQLHPVLSWKRRGDRGIEFALLSRGFMCSRRRPKNDAEINSTCDVSWRAISLILYSFQRRYFEKSPYHIPGGNPLL